MNDIAHNVVSYLHIEDITTCFRVSKQFAHIGRWIIQRRIDDVLSEAVGDRYQSLRAVLDNHGGVILKSSGMELLLTGSLSEENHELRIAIPNHATDTVAAFFRDMGFITLKEIPTAITPRVYPELYPHLFLQRDGKTIVVVSSNASTIVPVVLAHRTTVDCMFATTGGIFYAYPSFMDRKLAYGPFLAPSSLYIHGLVNRGFRVQICNHRWTQPCEDLCPALWRNIQSGRIINWGSGTNPASSLGNQVIMWRLARRCENCTCPNNVCSDIDTFFSPYTHGEVRRAIKRVKARNVDRPFVTGLLFAQMSSTPITVPVFPIKGTEYISSLDDLEIHPFIRENGLHTDNVIDGNCTRQTFVTDTITFTVIRDHDDALRDPSRYASQGPYDFGGRPRYHPLSPPRGNTLVIKHLLPNGMLPIAVSFREFRVIGEIMIHADRWGELFGGKLRTVRSS